MTITADQLLTETRITAAELMEDAKGAMGDAERALLSLQYSHANIDSLRIDAPVFGKDLLPDDPMEIDKQSSIGDFKNIADLDTKIILNHLGDEFEGKLPELLDIEDPLNLFKDGPELTEVELTAFNKPNTPSNLGLEKFPEKKFTDSSEYTYAITAPEDLITEEIPDNKFDDDSTYSFASNFDTEIPFESDYTVSTELDYPEIPTVLNNIDTDLIIADLPERIEPIKPVIIIPGFDEIAPIDQIDETGDLNKMLSDGFNDYSTIFKSVIQESVDGYLIKYNPKFHDQMRLLEDKVAKYIAGGTAMTDEVEDAIYQKAKDRNYIEYRKSLDSVRRESSRNGFILPNGVVQASSMNARFAFQDSNARTSADIAIKHAELEQANNHFALTLSNNLRTSMLSSGLNYVGSILSGLGQALDAAKTIVSSRIQYINSQIAIYNARLEAYKIKATVYETRLRAVTALIDIYKAEINALEALTNVDRAKIELVKTKADVLQVAASVYKTQMDAVNSKLELERLKISNQELKIKAFQLNLEIKKSKWDGYLNQIKGEDMIQRIKLSDQELKLKEFQTIKDLEIKGRQLNLDIKKTEWDGYLNQIKGEDIIQRIKLSDQELKLKEFQTSQELELKGHQLNLDIKKAEWDGFNSKLKGEELIISSDRNKLEANKLKAEIYSKEVQIVSDKLNAIYKHNDQLQQQYKNQILNFTTLMDTDKSKLSILNDVDKQKMAILALELQKYVAMSEIEMTKTKLNMQVNVDNVKNKFDATIKDAELMIKKAESVAQTSTSLANIYSNTASTVASSVIGMVSKSDV